MSIHLGIKEYKCEKCKTIFLPYSKGLLCPKCSTPEESENEESYKFIEKQVNVMMLNKMKYNQFSPLAWYTHDYCDQLQIIISSVFDKKYHSNKECDFLKEAMRIKLYDGEGNQFENGAYLTMLFNKIDKLLYPALESFNYQKKLLAQKKEDAKLKNRLKRFKKRLINCLENIKNKYFSKPVCLCDEPLCAKCLSENCKVKNCLIHTKEAKLKWKIKNNKFK